MGKYRLSYFRLPTSTAICWNKLPEDVIEKIPTGYYYNCYCVDGKGELDEMTYILLDPVKKFKKSETIVKLSEEIELGLDDF